MESTELRIEKVEERLNENDKRLNQHGKRLERHEERLNDDKVDIQNLKDYDLDKHKRLKIVEENYARLETTVAKENEETRATMREQTKRLFDIVEQAMGNQESRTTQNHELKMAKLNTWSTVFLKVSGGVAGLGGAIYYVVQHILNN